MMFRSFSFPFKVLLKWEFTVIHSLIQYKIQNLLSSLLWRPGRSRRNRGWWRSFCFYKNRWRSLCSGGSFSEYRWTGGGVAKEENEGGATGADSFCSALWGLSNLCRGLQRWIGFMRSDTVRYNFTDNFFWTLQMFQSFIDIRALGHVVALKGFNQEMNSLVGLTQCLVLKK